MLALRTGWTPAVIGGDAPDGISDDFRRAAHFALFAEHVAPLLRAADKAAALDSSGVKDPRQYAAITRARLAGKREQQHLRELLELDEVTEGG
jgi:hypothetical protein